MREQLGPYRILEHIGSGGMGRVYRAHDERLEREVALKVLPDDALSDDVARRRFRREALALSRMNHPNIATIHAFDTIEEMDVLVMEHIPGASLDHLLRQGPLPEREVLRFGRQLADALAAAHERKIIHRDLKPGNVRVTPEGRLKVLDFGLARALQADADARTESITGPVLAGTLPYMAPEQVCGKTIDHRTDIYAAGAILYEMATGTRVHDPLSGPPLIAAIVGTLPRSASTVNPEVSGELNRIVTKALDKDPQLRYQSARELAVDLERLAGGSAVASLPPPSRKHLARTAIVAGVVALTCWAVYLNWPAPAPLAARGWIVVADFDNRTGDDRLSDAIRAGLTVQLQQSQYVNVLSRDQIFDTLRRMQRADLRLLDVDTARELALREAVPVLLAGSIQRSGDVTRLEARGIEAVSEAVLFAELVDYRNDSEVFDRIDELARRVRRRLGESAAAIQQRSEPLDKVTTQSFDALKQYSKAADDLARGSVDTALPLLRTAIDVDPDFAMAHRLLARVYETLGNVQREREHLERAYALRHGLTERERRHVEASYYKGRDEYERAVQSLIALTSLYPADAEGRYELALAHRDAGETAKAVQELETTITQTPFVTGAYGDLVLQLARMGSYDRARAVYEEAQSRNVRAPKLDWAYGMVLLGEGRPDLARMQFEKLEKTSEVYAGIARLYEATADTLEGKLSSAAERLRAGVLLDLKANNFDAEFKRRSLLIKTLLLSDRRAEARSELDGLMNRGSGRLGANEWRIAGTLSVALGDLTLAAELLRSIDIARAQTSSAFRESCYQNLAGEIALATGRLDDALQAFSSASAQYPRALTTGGLARTFSARRDWHRSRESWRKLIASRGEIIQEGFGAEWALAHLEVARTSRALGDIATARREYDKFLTMWKDAESMSVLRMAAAESRTLSR
jgi:tetratricopeptide (TPR) repeat protein/tRNA A-37 threonylcarbamoyl transferase component Bud32